MPARDISANVSFASIPVALCFADCSLVHSSDDGYRVVAKINETASDCIRGLHAIRSLCAQVVSARIQFCTRLWDEGARDCFVGFN